MPPLLSDNEASDDDVPTNGVPKHTESNVEADVEAKNQLKDDLVTDIASTKGKKAARAEEERDTSPEEGGEEEEEEEEEVYEVEAIRAHEWRGKKLLYEVKWKGYPESDNTLEPEGNLVTSTESLARYHHKIGGAPQPPGKSNNLKKQASRKSLRDSGASATEDSPAPPAKRQKRAKADDPALSDDLDRETTMDDYQPKGNNWETQVKEIQTVERDEKTGDLFIFLEFKNGRKSRIKNGKIRTVCPQKLLDFYEAHLNFSVANSSIAYHTKSPDQEELALSSDSEA